MTDKSQSFANLFASFANAVKNADDPWDDSALADDVASISYEQALRSHRRVRVPEPALGYTPPRETRSAGSASVADSSAANPGRKRKSASITIRLTEAEQAQLHERAAEAKLSISAYLRSCVFEAESLRAQVKEALSQMRSASDETHVPGKPDAVPLRRFRFFPRWAHTHKA